MFFCYYLLLFANIWSLSSSECSWDKIYRKVCEADIILVGKVTNISKTYKFKSLTYYASINVRVKSIYKNKNKSVPPKNLTKHLEQGSFRSFGEIPEDVQVTRVSSNVVCHRRLRKKDTRIFFLKFRIDENEYLKFESVLHPLVINLKNLQRTLALIEGKITKYFLI